MQWTKGKLPIGFNGQNNHDVYTAQTNTYAVQALNAGGGKSIIFNNEQVCHWVLGFVKPDGIATRYPQKGKMFEPSYRQKLMVLKEIGVWKEIALEVMPPQFDVVDREDCYHLWEFQYPYSFIFDHRPIYEAPEKFEDEFHGIQYCVRTIGNVRYIYFKPKNANEQIGWKKKQNLKNLVMGMDGTAVELILDGMADKHYACMVCLPQGKYLDFGLV